VLIQTVDVPSEQPALCLLYSPNEFAVALRGRNRPSGIVHPEKREEFGPDRAASRAFGLLNGETGAKGHEQDLEGLDGCAGGPVGRGQLHEASFAIRKLVSGRNRLWHRA
jgi:hypothetical protein